MIFLNNYGVEPLYKRAILTLSLPAVAQLGRRRWGRASSLELVISKRMHSRSVVREDVGNPEPDRGG